MIPRDFFEGMTEEEVDHFFEWVKTLPPSPYDPSKFEKMEEITAEEFLKRLKKKEQNDKQI
jgi:hypothetical protein